MTQPRAGRPLVVGVVLGSIGGAALVVGSFLTWLTLSVDFTRLSRILGVDASTLESLVPRDLLSAPGTQGWQGWVTMAAGVLCLAGAVLVIALQPARRSGNVMILIGALVGIGVVIYTIAWKNGEFERQISSRSSTLGQLGLTVGTIRSFMSLSSSIGLWICLVGGVTATLGGLIALLSQRSAPIDGALAGAVTVEGAMNAGFAVPPPPGAHDAAAGPDEESPRG